MAIEANEAQGRVVKPKIEMLINHPIIVYYDSTYKMGNFGTKIIKIG